MYEDMVAGLAFVEEWQVIRKIFIMKVHIITLALSETLILALTTLYSYTLSIAKNKLLKGSRSVRPSLVTDYLTIDFVIKNTIL